LEKRSLTKSFGEISFGGVGLKEESLVLFGTEAHGDLRRKMIGRHMSKLVIADV